MSEILKFLSARMGRTRAESLTLRGGVRIRESSLDRSIDSIRDCTYDPIYI